MYKLKRKVDANSVYCRRKKNSDSENGKNHRKMPEIVFFTENLTLLKVGTVGRVQKVPKMGTVAKIVSKLNQFTRHMNEFGEGISFFCCDLA